MTGVVLNLGGETRDHRDAPNRGDWAPLGYLSLYRLVLAGLFTLLILSEAAPRPLGNLDAALFAGVSLAYLLFAVASAAALRARRPAFEVQLVVSITADLIALAMLMYSSGGVNSGFGMLLVVAVAGGSILSRGRVAYLFAATASVAVLVQQIILSLERWVPVSDYTHGGMLGLGFFATAALAQLSARRIRASETLAQQHAVDLASLAQLNEHIIQRMQSGVMVIDDDARVRLVNGSAQSLLAIQAPARGAALADVAPALAALLSRWREDTDRSSYLSPGGGAGVDLVVSFAAIGDRSADAAVVFIEDASAMYQRAQQLKLASLGRLTASIAHEIRNPLGAISHASQLLAENPELPRAEQRLTEIVHTNARRVNEIIESVLQLSRRKPADPQPLELHGWLRGFRDEFQADAPLSGHIGVTVSPSTLTVRFDPGQLRQVLWNLCENGLRHGGEHAEVELCARINPDSERPCLDVTDNGPGLAADHSQHVFEPFFTTRAEGSGLGLYIARELCESNQASLALLPSARGACFRVTFADPRRQGLTA